MDTINPFEELILPPSAAVGLKEGINIGELISGATFEVDMSTVAKEPKDNFSKSEEILRQLDLSCTLGEDSDTPPFKQLERSMTDITTDKLKGIMKKVIRKGLGPVIPEGSLVRVHYNGYLEYADEPYDSTRLRNRPLKIRLGNGQVIPGLELGVATMKKSEVAQFLVKPEYAFGKMGCPPRIPPDATILFEVELLSFVDSKAANEYETMSDEGRQKLSFDDIVKVAKSEKETGNDALELKHYGKAAGHYSKGIRLLEPAHLKDDEEEARWKELLIKLYLNLALANLKQCKSSLAITHCRRVLELDSQNTKATFRLGQAYMQLSEWERSKRCFLAAVKLAPNNEEIRQELEKLDKRVRQFQLLEKDICSKMFKDHNHSQPSGDHKRVNELSNCNNTVDPSLKETFKEKLMSFKESSYQREIVLPLGTSEREVQCIVQLAQEMELIVELGNTKTSYSVKVMKLRPEELPLHYDY